MKYWKSVEKKVLLYPVIYLLNWFSQHFLAPNVYRNHINPFFVKLYKFLSRWFFYFQWSVSISHEFLGKFIWRFFIAGIYRNKIRGRKNEELTDVYVIVLAVSRAIGVRLAGYRTCCSRELSLNITICLEYCVMQPAQRYGLRQASVFFLFLIMG